MIRFLTMGLFLIGRQFLWIPANAAKPIMSQQMAQQSQAELRPFPAFMQYFNLPKITLTLWEF
jgi:hypothetical protein